MIGLILWSQANLSANPKFKESSSLDTTIKWFDDRAHFSQRSGWNHIKMERIRILQSKIGDKLINIYMDSGEKIILAKLERKLEMYATPYVSQEEW